MKGFGSFFGGIGLLILGAVLFLQNITVDGFSLYRYSEVNVGAIVIILLAVAFVTMLVKTNVITVSIFAILALIFIIVMILSVQFRIKKMSALALVIIIAVLCVGIALVIKGLLGLNKKE